MELRPEASCSLIDTDVVMDLDVSNEYEQHVATETAQAVKGRQVQESVSVSYMTPAVPAQMAKPMMPLAVSHVQEMDVDDDEELVNRNPDPQPTVRLISLKPEPTEEDSQRIIRCRVRLPTRQVAERSFLRTDPMAHLFDLVELRLRETNGQFDRPFRLATTFPRQVYTSDVHTSRSFADAGLDQTQQSFVVEFV
jgi:hypothetical protein